MSQIIKTAVIGVFVVGLAGAIGYSAMKKNSQPETAQSASTNSNLTVINGVITSEKESFFKDPRVKAAFEKKRSSS